MGGDGFAPALATFSGFYDRYKRNRWTGVLYRERRSDGKAIFSFCPDLRAWTFAYNAEVGNSTDDQDDIDPCRDWHARSSATSTFDLLETQDMTWYARSTRDIDGDDRVVILDQFHMSCQTCTSPDADKCSGHGTCYNAVCSCEEEWFGLNCEFAPPCNKIHVDNGTTVFPATTTVVAAPTKGKTHQWATQFEILERATDDNGTSSTISTTPMTPIIVYQRPVYIGSIGNESASSFDFIVFNGRRWLLLNSNDVAMSNMYTSSSSGQHRLQQLSRRQALALFLESEFHAFWSHYSVAYISDPMDILTVSDGVTPVDTTWYTAQPKLETGRQEVQAPDSAQKQDTVLLCN